MILYTDKKVSPTGTVNSADLKRVASNAIVFAGPALLVLLADLSRAFPDWFSGATLVVAVYVLNFVTDLLRKFLSSSK